MTDLDAGRIYLSRPVVNINVHSPVRIFEDSLSVRYAESAANDTMLELTVNNWGVVDGGVGYKYTEFNPIHTGDSVSLCFGEILMMSGEISTLNPHFNEGAPPTLTFFVTGAEIS